MNSPIYLDYNATTPVDPAVVDAMAPYLCEHFGNPSSAHPFGKLAHEAVDQARQQVADLIGARPQEIVFTGGGSEASNQAIKGVAFPRLFGTSGSGQACLRDALGGGFVTRLKGLFRRAATSLHIITSAVEHPATLRPLAFLRELGCDVTILRVDRQGVVDLDHLRQALRKPTLLVSIMHSNNEVGTLQPIQEIARLAQAQGALVHTDAAQSLGKVSLEVNELGIDLLTIAGHKLYAPKGVGALYVREGLTLEPLIHGAGHEAGRRAGTENVPYIVALGKACEIARDSLGSSGSRDGLAGRYPATDRLRSLRDRLWALLQEGLGDDVVLNGHAEKRLPNTLNVNFRGWVGAELLAACPEIAASTGSACHEGHIQLSPVLEAMGVPPELGRGAVRLSVGRFTTEAEVDRAAEVLVCRAARATAPVG
jgi:cysteine desulfurase